MCAANDAAGASALRGPLACLKECEHQLTCLVAVPHIIAADAPCVWVCLVWPHEAAGLPTSHFVLLVELRWGESASLRPDRVVADRRTPQGIRAMSRCYVTLLIPIFFGPYYASLHQGLGTAFAVIIAIVVWHRSPFPSALPPAVTLTP